MTVRPVPALKPLRAPRSPEQAIALLDQVARLDAERIHIKAIRDENIADSNRVADDMLVPIVERRAAIAKLLEAWWAADGKALLKGKRKTIELGGCVIGTKAAPLALTFGNADDFDVALERLRAERWAKPYVRVTYAIDKKATKEALAGKHGEQLRAMGFATRGGVDVFVLDPVKQGGTVAAT